MRTKPVMELFTEILGNSPQNAQFFIDKDGMGMLGWVLKSLNPHKLTNDILEGLEDMYRYLESAPLKSGLLKQVWLDFGMWSRTSFNTQMDFQARLISILQTAPINFEFSYNMWRLPDVLHWHY